MLRPVRTVFKPSYSTFLSTLVSKTLNEPLSKTDPKVFDLIEKEKQRQRNTIDLIASEVS